MNEEEIINKYARKVLGFKDDEIIDYDVAVNHYIFMLNYCVIFFDDKKIIDEDFIETLNFSLDACTGYILQNYMSINVDADENLEKQKNNYHYNALIETSNKIMTRFFEHDKIEIGHNIGRNLYRIANAIYLKETDQKTRLYS